MNRDDCPYKLEERRHKTDYRKKKRKEKVLDVAPIIENCDEGSEGDKKKKKKMLRIIPSTFC